MKIGRIHQYHHDLVNVRVYQPQQQHLLPSHKNMIQIIFMNRSTIPFHSRLMLNSMSIMPLSKMQTIRSCGVHTLQFIHFKAIIRQTIRNERINETIHLKKRKKRKNNKIENRQKTTKAQFERNV